MTVPNSFSQFLDEAGVTPIPVEAYGETFDLPRTLPTLLRLFLAHMDDVDPGETVDNDTYHTAVAALVERDRLDRWLAAGVTDEELGLFVGYALSLYADRARGRLGETLAPPAGLSLSEMSSNSGT